VADQKAQAAVDGLNGKEVMERQIFVSVARPPQPRQPRFNDRRGGDRGGYNNRRSYDNDR
jgi:RNA recognition motif-containing protein